MTSFVTFINAETTLFLAFVECVFSCVRKQQMILQESGSNDSPSYFLLAFEMKL